MTHTNKNPVVEYTREIYEVTIFESDKTCTAQIRATTNGRVQKKSFRSKYGGNRRAAEDWAKTQIDNFLESKELWKDGAG